MSELDPHVELAIERLRGDVNERLGRFEERLNGVLTILEQRPPPLAPEPAPTRGSARAATIGAASAGFTLGLFEGIRRLLS